ncbi:MAG: hypothetical protein WCP63_08195 [Cyanobium sp. ELA712]|jgi:hypothetical protein
MELFITFVDLELKDYNRVPSLNGIGHASLPVIALGLSAQR